MEGETERTGRVQSVERALGILEFLSRSGGALGVSEIGEATDLAVGTVHRLLGTLTAQGYVRRDERTRRYDLGPKSLMMAIAARERIGPLALPFLEELVQVSQETANLAMLEGNSAVYIEQASPPTRMLRIFTEPGNRIPLHSCGTGKVLLAYQSPRLIDFVIARTGLPRQTVSTITDPSQLRTELEKVRKDGYAVDFEEQEEGVRCLATPVFGPNGEVFAAMSISGPASRLKKGRVDELVPDVKRISASFSEAFGSS
ncbi:MAG: IclR family transcriptional regulator [Actinobacteria bacterium]|nr:IclR family transcriptional regulator [Actinomycetota bacterium]